MKTHLTLLVFVLMLAASSAAIAEEEFDRDLQAAKKVWTITLAIHHFYDHHRMLPEAYSYDKKAEKRLLSWRVHLLPFIGHEELFKKFKLNEPWNSQHNKTLIAEMPSLYAAPGGANRAEGKTCFLAIRADRSAFPPERRISFDDIKDGKPQTLMLVEANDKNAVIWTKPDDYELPENPVEGLLRKDKSGFIVCMCNGGVYRMSKEIDVDIFRTLSHRDDGAPRSNDEWREFVEPLRTREVKLVDVP